MLDENTGWRSLSAIISLVRIKGADMSAYEDWREHRSAEVEDMLGRLCQLPEVRCFIDRYAEAQADRVRALLAADALNAAGDILIDVHEELLRQAVRYSEVVSRAVGEPTRVQTDADMTGRDTAANQNLAMAA